jgi:hypothetical protein
MAVQDFPGTRVDEISDGIFRISTPVASLAGGGITYISTCSSMTSHCSFTPGSGACSQKCRMP